MEYVPETDCIGTARTVDKERGQGLTFTEL
jgi:hypothetical protein